MNLFAVYPSYNNAFPMYGMMDIMFSIPELMVHMMIGVLIGLLSLMIFMMTLMLGDYKSMVVSAIASISILLAGLSGLEFIFSNFQNNTFSFTMSIELKHVSSRRHDFTCIFQYPRELLKLS